jgi:hypothetical protein
MYQLAYDPSIAGVVRFLISCTEVASHMTDSHRRLVADNMTKTVTEGVQRILALGMRETVGRIASSNSLLLYD